MRTMRMARLDPWNASLSVAALLGLALYATACQPSAPPPQPVPEPFAESATADPGASEAERTRQMEERAAAANAALQAAQQGNLSEAEALEAYRQFEREKKAIDSMGEGQPPAPPPPPPQP
jgi:hypothetical protein